jgi:hypothetical protein
MFKYYFKKIIYVFFAALSPKMFLKIQFRRVVGFWPNLNNPKLFSEKIQWLKLYYHDPLLTVCADKYEVRSYLKEKGFGNMLNDIIGVWNNVDEIDYNNLPKSFVLKSTHGTAQIIICTNKSEFNFFNAKKEMNEWLKKNPYFFGLEWSYKNIQPRIICEKLIETAEGTLPRDYKVFCFNGVPRFIHYLTNRTESSVNVDYYDCDWNKLDIQLSKYKSSKIQATKPVQLSEVLRVSEIISKDFPFVRVDFYIENNKILIGELTFYPTSGFGRIKPQKYDMLFGEFLVLPPKLV